jgi:hypothetical protein
LGATIISRVREVYIPLIIKQVKTIYVVKISAKIFARPYTNSRLAEEAPAFCLA